MFVIGFRLFFDGYIVFILLFLSELENILIVYVEFVFGEVLLFFYWLFFNESILV